MVVRRSTGEIRFALFGTRPLASGVLEQLAKADLFPARTVTSASVTEEFISNLASERWDVFVVASFGAMLPRRFLDVPRRGVVNVHPSLLPRLRGPSPIRSAILRDEKETGITIMRVDERMDHGPIIAQRKVSIDGWPPRGAALDERMAQEGGALLAEVLPLWIDGKLEERPQQHNLATYCSTFKKEDGLVDLANDAYHNLLKIRAMEGWPGAYTFFERAGKRIRVQILDAHLERGTLSIDLVKPEGKREMPYEDFLRSGAAPAR